MPPLLTPHELLLKTSEPHSQISVHNLSTTLALARDAWGRPSKPQPLLISCSLSLRHPFSSASSSDTVTNSTIHYGTLSKAILEGCEEFRELCEDELMPMPMHIRALVCYLQFYLTGCDTLPRIASSHINLPPDTTSTPSSNKITSKVKEMGPLINCSMLNSLFLEILLPKASLLGSGVSLKGDFIYQECHHGPSAYSMVLQLRELRVPATIGVNGNERKAKQVIVASVEMERWNRMVDAYNELEEIVVKSIDESSFQTLEALCAHLAHRIITYFLLPRYPLPFSQDSRSHSDPDHHQNPRDSHPGWNYQRIRIRLSKPTAVMFADAPTVEYLVDSDPSKSAEVKELWKAREREQMKQVPYPLEGRLDEWIEKNELHWSGERGDDRELQ